MRGMVLLGKGGGGVEVEVGKEVVVGDRIVGTVGMTVREGEAEGTIVGEGGEVGGIVVGVGERFVDPEGVESPKTASPLLST